MILGEMGSFTQKFLGLSRIGHFRVDIVLDNTGKIFVSPKTQFNGAFRVKVAGPAHHDIGNSGVWDGFDQFNCVITCNLA